MTSMATRHLHCGKVLVPRRRRDDGLPMGPWGRTRTPAGWLADGPCRAQTVLALREPAGSGSMKLGVAGAHTWERCGTARGMGPGRCGPARGVALGGCARGGRGNFPHMTSMATHHLHCGKVLVARRTGLTDWA